MTAPESLSSLGERFLALARQTKNSGVVVSILAGQLRRQQKNIAEAQAILDAGQGRDAAEAVSVPMKGLGRANMPGD
jgi:hypothetical protein